MTSDAKEVVLTGGPQRLAAGVALYCEGLYLDCSQWFPAGGYLVLSPVPRELALWVLFLLGFWVYFTLHKSSGTACCLSLFPFQPSQGWG